ncbi:hypothetical protein GCM10010185_24830 [Saccharothrix coeruleofusca]|uniref:Uncharacterized protein n=1 Tax=Saccharothrix coeruleofusca TaxID=33919 RepID=A0A918EEC6_9PSEU|nr:hypothetical protein GCM10010185_24830 [Saccharothrix coeruleofusca]
MQLGNRVSDVVRPEWAAIDSTRSPARRNRRSSARLDVVTTLDGRSGVPAARNAGISSQVSAAGPRMLRPARSGRTSCDGTTGHVSCTGGVAERGDRRGAAHRVGRDVGTLSRLPLGKGSGTEEVPRSGEDR